MILYTHFKSEFRLDDMRLVERIKQKWFSSKAFSNIQLHETERVGTYVTAALVLYLHTL